MDLSHFLKFSVLDKHKYKKGEIFENFDFFYIKKTEYMLENKYNPICSQFHKDEFHKAPIFKNSKQIFSAVVNSGFVVMATIESLTFWHTETMQWTCNPLERRCSKIIHASLWNRVNLNIVISQTIVKSAFYETGYNSVNGLFLHKQLYIAYPHVSCFTFVNY